MATDNRIARFILDRDWRIWFGLVLTSGWIGGGIWYVNQVSETTPTQNFSIEAVGSFLEGAFAPLAFLWLVIGHFMQQKEITANTRAIHIQERSARRLEIHSQRDSYFQLLNLVQDQLGSIAGFHYMSVCGPTGTGEITGPEFSEQRSQAGTGDHAWFLRKMVSLAAVNMEDPENLQDIFFGTDIRTRHSNNFSKTFKKLLDAARAVDTDDMLEDALLYGSAAGLLYRIIRHVAGDELIDPILGVSTPPIKTTPVIPEPCD